MLGAGSVLGPVLEPGEGAWSGSLRPLVTETPWASASELQRSKLREDSHLLAGETARRTGVGRPVGAGLDAPLSAEVRSASRR